MMPTCEEMLAGSRAAHVKALRDCRDSMARMLEIIDELKATLDETLAGWNEGIDTLNQVVAHNHELAAKLAKAREFILLHRTYYLHSYEVDNFLAELGETKEHA